MLELLKSPIDEFVVVNCPPGSGKSTLFMQDFMLWLICQDRTIRILLGSATARLAEKYSNRLRRMLELTRPLRANPVQGRVYDAEASLPADFGRFKPASVTGETWTKSEFTVAQWDGESVEDKEPTVSAFGMDSELLGLRANVIGWDDLVTSATIRNAERVADLQAWWTQEAETRLEPGGLLILQGQRMGANDLYRYCLDMGVPEGTDWGRNKKYHHIIYPAHFEDKCAGDHGKNAKPWPEGCLLDPVRLSWSKLQTIRHNRGDAFRVQYQQEDVDPEDVLVPMIWITGGRDPETGEQYPGCWDTERAPAQIPKGLAQPLLSIATADPSPTKFWAITWWLIQPETQSRFLLDLHRRVMDAPEFLDWNARTLCFTGLMEEWQLRSVDMGYPISHWIVEQNAAQRFLLQYDHVHRWQAARKVRIIGHSTHRNKTDPDYGVQMLKNLYRYGQVRLPGAQYGRHIALALVDEVTRWPQSTTDDCVMAQWFLEYHFANGNLWRDRKRTPVQLRRPSWMKRSR
jgi:hypothetical protein